jgi:2-keto-3-deoxy-L-rhamnonate aldolase RhmA
MSLATRLRAGEPVVGNWLTLTDPAAGEISAALDFDFVVVDTEHTPLSLESVTDVVRGVESRGATAPLVRVAGNDPVSIKRVLDLGAAGVMAPMVETAAEAEAFAEATRYPPTGTRGVAPARASDYGETFESSLEETDPLAIPQIESPSAVDNAADIAAVDGVDALFVGPLDLSTSLGVPGETESDRFRDAVDRVLDAGAETDTPVGTLAIGSEDVEHYADVGFDFQIVGVDFAYLLEGSREAKATYERVTSGE